MEQVLFLGAIPIPYDLFCSMPRFAFGRTVCRLSLFPDWQSAKKASTLYEDEHLNAFRVARASSYEPSGKVLLGTALGLVALAINRDDLSVTDFGGSCGELGREFLGKFQSAKYSVVENSTLVNLMRGKLTAPEFASSIPDECDIFYTSGTLQYLDDPIAILKHAFRTARYAVILARNSFCDRPLFRIQISRLFENGSGPLPIGFQDNVVTYPHRTINEDQILQLANESRFDCIARLEEQSGVYRFRGRVYGKQMIFLRRGFQ